MIDSSSLESASPSFRLLNPDQIRAIKRAAFEILEKTGCQVLHAGARKLLEKAGAVVKDDRVKMPRHLVKQCLHTAPKGFTIYDREGNPALEVRGRRSYYGTSTASPNTRDVSSGEVRETRVSDIAVGARVADALRNIDWIMPMGSSQDVSPFAADVHEFQASVTNTTKPICFIGYTARGTELVFEMAAQVAGGLDRLRERPFLILYPEPISPLVFPAHVVDRMFVAADLGMPQIPGSALQPGATSPVTLAGTVVQGIAEGLASLVLVQLRSPGAPCALAVNILVFDMATAQVVQAAPETSLGVAARSEMAQSWGLPTWGLAGAGDSKLLDAQAGIESTFSILAQGLAGLNLIHDVGYLDRGMICSAEMLAMGDEVIGMARRFLRGMEITSETLAQSVIEKVGPGGHFLEEDHTYRHFKKELWFPTLLSRQTHDQWESAGSKDMAQRVREKVIGILENHQVPSLPDKTLAALEELKRQGEAELARLESA